MKPLLFLLLAIVAATASAQSVDDESPPPATMVVGNADGAYVDDASGPGWLALACNAQGCALEPARVDTKGIPPSIGDYLDAPKAKLVRAHPDGRTVVAWLQPPQDSSLPWLRPGPVPTYGTESGGFPRPHTAGTYELSVMRSGKEIARMVPMIDPKARQYVLQLRVHDQRQVLDHVLWQCTGSGGTGYLLWAGDLDRDGQPDYLVNFLDEDGKDALDGRGYVVLYLSSYATADEIVGTAAESVVDNREDCPGVPASAFSTLAPVADKPDPTAGID